MRKSIQILSDTRIYPTAFNVIEGANKVDTAVYTMVNYVVNEHDLSKYGWYAHLYGVEGIDEVKLTSEVTDDGLVITFDLNEYVTNVGNTLTYQLVAKDSDGAVYYTSKGVILNSESIQADEFIAANYPSIMKQWEDRMSGLYNDIDSVKDEYLDEMEETRADLEKYATDFTNSVFYIPWDEAIPVEDRLDGRLYFQYTDAERTKGRFEDPDGNSLIAEAKGGSSLPMFAPVWSDHLYNDASYLRADTFSWHNSSIYVTGYNKLLAEYNNESSVEETDDSGITYKLSPNGFKIADASQEEAISALYLSDEKAWYYILDIENARFKLPREKKSDGKYLYFFLGAYEREEGEINVGILTEMANGTDIEVIVNEINEVKDSAISEINTATDSEIARLQNSGIDDLQAQIDNLKAELNTMLGRMDFANSETFWVRNDDEGDLDYTCPSDGYIQFNATSDTGAVYINEKYFCSMNAINAGCVSMIPVSTGDIVSVNSYSIQITFIPQKGV